MAEQLDEDEKIAQVSLNMVPGIGGKIFRRILNQFDTARDFLDAGPGAWRRIDGIGDQIAVRLQELLEEGGGEREFEEARDMGLQLLTIQEPAYPSLLKTVHDPPAVLSVMGDLSDRDRFALAVVGTRGCTHYGTKQAKRFASMLAYRGITVVSGLARGIDTAAHKGTLQANGRTIAVLGSGLKNIYPRENEELVEEILDGDHGAVVSELPLDTPPDSSNFPQRNRIISGLSMGVLVVEAPSRSGALITVDLALDQNREVFALPGNVDSPKSQGTNNLIQEGAKLVMDVEDILEELQGYVELQEEDREQANETEVQGREPELASEVEEKIFGELSSDPVTIDELAERMDIPGNTIASALTKMEIRGLVEQLPGKTFVRS